MGKRIISVLLILVPVVVSAQDDISKKLYDLHRHYKKIVDNDTAAVNQLIKIGYYHQELLEKKPDATSKDSLLIFAKKALNISLSSGYKKGLGMANLLFSEYEAYNNDNKKALRYTEKSIEIFKEINYRQGLAEAYLFVTHLDDLKPTENSISAGLKAYNIYKELGDFSKQGYALRQIGYQYMALTDYKKALSFFKESIEAYEKTSSFSVESLYAYSGAGHASNRLGNYSEGFSYYLEAVRLGEEEAPGTKEMLHCLNGLGVSYINQAEYDKAYLYLTRAYTIAQKFNDDEQLIDLEANIVQALVKMKKYTESLPYLKLMEKRYGTARSRISIIVRSIDVYVALKDFKKAEKFVKEAVKLINTEDNGFHTSRLYLPISKYYYATGQYSLSRKYLEDYKPIAEKSSSKVALQNVHRELFKLDSIEKAFNSAIANLKLYQSYKDSLYSEDSQKRIYELVVKYDVLKKERDLQLKENNNKLLIKQNELQQEKLYRSNLTRNVSVAGTGVLIVFLGLLFHRHSVNKRTNKLLQAQQTVITSSNEKLLRLVDEKEWLLKEIHHRVKNNLHIVMSLLNSQSYFLKDKSALEAIQNSTHRIQAMSLIHQKLYMSENLAAISMPEYVSDLIEYLSDSFSTHRNIKFHLRIEKVEMDVSQAVPIGLILNEGITNCFKYAFSNGSGNISVSLTNTIGDNFCLEIKDDGKGVPQGFNIMQAKSLGMKLISGLTQDLDGKIDIISTGNGTHLIIEFAYKHLLFNSPN